MKKILIEWLECEEKSQNETRKFYQKIIRLSQDKKSGEPNCRNEHGILVAYSQSALRIWHHPVDDDPNSVREIALV